MEIDQIFELANKFRAENNITMAVQLYNEVLKADARYAMVHVNMTKILNAQGNFQGEYEALKLFMKSPLTPATLDFVAPAKQRLEELEKMFTQKPA